LKLLFDENLSPRLVRELAAEFPDSAQVDDAGLRAHSDAEVWAHARWHGFVIASKGERFPQAQFPPRTPTQVLWLAVGNAGTDVIARILRDHRAEIEAMVADPDAALLILRGS
jgi:predicted nuclease of predicted toxin-antitoxin system